MAMRYPGGLIATSPVNAAYPSGVWTQSQTIPYASQNVWQQDQYWRNTTLLLHGDGTNGAQNNTFLDSSSNNFSITRNGNTTQGAFTPFQQNGYWSNYFADTGSSNANYFSRSISGALSTTLSGSTQTREFWINRTVTSTSTFAPVIRILNGDQGTIYFSGGELRVYNGAVIIAVNWSAVPVGVWTHIALTQSGGTVTLWINGVSQGTSSSTISSTGTDITIGGASDGLSVGYVSNLRISNSARYSSAFTPSTTPFANDGNTTLLICQNNRFVDNSSNAFTFTNFGTPSVQAFQPFLGPTTWSASVLGGSGYFDGSGDSLTAPSGACISGTGDFTAECWIFPTTVPGSYNIIGCSDSSNGLTMFGLNANGTVFYGRSGVSVQGTTSNSLNYNTWNHIAISRSSSTLKMFINGVQGFSGTETYSYASGTVRIGTDIGGSQLPYTGYISGFRIIQGSAIYTTGFTPPTAPLTAVSGTSLLLNMTNAGIFDNAQMNNLETVGNAQISTSVVKYGTGSMYFDGNGDYLPVPYSPNLNMGTGDFTCEFWVYVPSNPSVSYPSIVGPQDQIPYGIGIRYGNTGYANKFTVHLYGVAGWVGDPILASSTYSLSQWHHVALTRSGTTLTLWVNGVSAASTTSSNQIDFASDNKAMWIGASFDGANSYFNGYIDDFRITKGVARYTANFTPPIARMPNQ